MNKGEIKKASQILSAYCCLCLSRLYDALVAGINGDKMIDLGREVAGKLRATPDFLAPHMELFLRAYMKQYFIYLSYPLFRQFEECFLLPFYDGDNSLATVSEMWVLDHCLASEVENAVAQYIISSYQALGKRVLYLIHSTERLLALSRNKARNYILGFEADVRKDDDQKEAMRRRNPQAYLLSGPARHFVHETQQCNEAFTLKPGIHHPYPEGDKRKSFEYKRRINDHWFKTHPRHSWHWLQQDQVTQNAGNVAKIEFIRYLDELKSAEENDDSDSHN